tara:strand:+ start:5584 stop:6759 length:1176 start_codon:yes stop_codon:yes gene_type:complete
MKMNTFDTIVVGAGPAGSTTARELATAGARVLVVDRAKWPRYKACGGGVPLRTERMLPFPIDSVVEDSVSRMELSARGRMAFTKLSHGPFARMVMRDRFDALLLEQAQQAGAELRTETVIRNLDMNGNVHVRGDGFEAEAETLICADGAHSPVGRMAELGVGLAECAAWEVEVKSHPKQASVGEATALIDLGYNPWGYAWLFPKAELLSIGIVLAREEAGRLKPLVDSYLKRLGLEGAEVEIARGHKIRFRRGGELIASERIALAGDAAGLADEFTAEGISYAIHSGQLAARATLEALSGEGDLRQYQDSLEAEIQPELDAARAIAYMFYGMLKHAQRPWMLASKFTPFLWDSLFAVQRGESSYAREAKRGRALTATAIAMLRRQDRQQTA